MTQQDINLPNPLSRAILGIGTRDGRPYWSAHAAFWRIATLFFLIGYTVRMVIAPAEWRAMPELFGIPGMNLAIGGISAVSAMVVAAANLMFIQRRRLRFNQAAQNLPK